MLFSCIHINSPKLTMRSISNDDGNTKKTPLEKRIRDMLKYFALSNIFKYFSFSNATDDSGSPKFDVVFVQGTAKKCTKMQNARAETLF